MEFLSGLLFIVSIVVSPNPSVELHSPAEEQAGGVFFVASSEESGLRAKHQEAQSGAAKIKILLVPGHDADSVGAQFRGLRETDLTARVADYLAEFFKEDEEFEIIPVRTTQGYAPQFAQYFIKERSEIQSFRNTYRLYMQTAVNAGLVTRHDGVPHNAASDEGSIKLYGVNRWANDNNVDLVLHLHFNDYADHGRNQAGRYSGFTLYVPERQLSNSSASIAIARPIFERLNGLFNSSDLPKEMGGILEDQSLIALGSNNSLNPPSILLEYGYIYEMYLLNADTRAAALKEFAFQTYAGIKDFFEKEAADSPSTTLLPHRWTKDLKEGVVGKDILSLQAALIREGVYPPEGKTRRDCPLTGYFKNCTELAVQAFQEKHGISPAMGYVGEKTREILNKTYGQ